MIIMIWIDSLQESYVILEKVIRSLANYYSKAGPSAPLSHEVKSEILDYLNTAEEFLQNILQCVIETTPFLTPWMSSMAVIKVNLFFNQFKFCIKKLIKLVFFFHENYTCRQLWLMLNSPLLPKQKTRERTVGKFSLLMLHVFCISSFIPSKRARYVLVSFTFLYLRSSLLLLIFPFIFTTSFFFPCIYIEILYSKRED